MFISPSAPEYPSSSLFPEPSITPSPHLEGDVRMTLAEFLDAMQSEIDEFLKLQGQNIVAETRVRLQYLKLRMETERQWGRTIEWTRAERDRFRSTLESVLGVDMHSAGVFASTHIVPRIAREAHIELWRETHEAIQRGENSQSLTGDIPSVFRTFESLAVTPEASTVSVFDMELHLSMSAHDSVSDAVDRLIAYSNRYNALIVTDESHRPIGLLRERDCVWVDSKTNISTVMSSLVPNMIVRPQTSRTEITEKMNTFETNVLPVTAADGQLVGFATLYGAQKTDIAQEATHHLTRARLELYLSALPK